MTTPRARSQAKDPITRREPDLSHGEPVMVTNTARLSWITATALMTALNMGILAYALSAFALVVGITMIASGVTFLSLRKALIA